MKNFKKFLVILIAAAMLMGIFAGTTFAANGHWQQDDRGRWHYYNEDGSEYKGWLQDGGSWYYLDTSGMIFGMATGLRMIDNKFWYFGSNGKLLEGKAGWFQESNGLWHYLNNDGSVKTGWFKSGGSWYYFESISARMMTGLSQIDGKWYFFGNNGKLVTKEGWQSVLYSNSEYPAWVYIDSNGSPRTGWMKENGAWYYFPEDSPGMSQFAQYINGKWYFFNSDGKLRLQKGWAYGRTSYNWRFDSDAWYYVNSDGTCYTGWLKDGGKWYYFFEGGQMATGAVTIDGKDYTFGENGALLSNPSGWQKITDYGNGTARILDEYWIYVNADGTYKSGWMKEGGYWYYFNPYDGYHMATGPQYIPDEGLYLFDLNGRLISKKGWHKLAYETETGSFYVGSDGKCLTGWQTIDGKRYYFNIANGGMYYDGYMQIDGKYYLFSSDGDMVQKKGWVKYTNKNGTWYVYLNADYTCYLGWVKAGSKWYYVNPEMVTDATIYVDGTRYTFDKNGALVK